VEKIVGKKISSRNEKLFPADTAKKIVKAIQRKKKFQFFLFLRLLTVLFAMKKFQ
jgi:hypothetical protein